MSHSVGLLHSWFSPLPHSRNTTARWVLSALIVTGVATALIGLLAISNVGAFSGLPSKAAFLIAGVATTLALSSLAFLVQRRRSTPQLQPPPQPASRAPAVPPHTCKYSKRDTEYVRGEQTAKAKMRKQTHHALTQEKRAKQGYDSETLTLLKEYNTYFQEYGIMQNAVKDLKDGDKGLASESFPHLSAAAGWMQGRRKTMEDEHLAIEIELQVGEQTYPARLFGVFDGHGSQKPATLVKERLPEILQKHAQELSSEFSDLDDIIPRAFTKAFTEIDAQIFQECNEGRRSQVGTCALCVLEIEGWLFFPNCGDSRAILIQKERTLDVTEEAYLWEERFSHRIEQEGHTITGEDIFKDVKDGPESTLRLEPARDLGISFVSPKPKIPFATLNGPENLEEGDVPYEEGDLVLLACDGLWDVTSSEMVTQDVRTLRSQGHSLQTIAKTLAGIAGRSRDNVTVILFEAGKPARGGSDPHTPKK